ncbi:MAG: rhodanese-like domain-containing protein [Actinomycetota bacterium]|jgi:hydroxyacylglutathione hydrolase|nr:rhodanese-like domain-containing protein [Actinomycetota bacterium]
MVEMTNTDPTSTDLTSTDLTKIELPGAIEIYQLSTPGLGDHSYLVRSGPDVAVIDPQRDLDRYRKALAELGGRLTVVAETHVHNDYVSGGRALATEHGATHVLPAGAGYAFGHHPVADGDEVPLGTVRLRSLHTPGHTPHHTSYAVLEHDEVVAVLSGGCVLVGACGRTDLVAPELTKELTRAQYHSAHRLGELPEPTAIGPTHGQGSFCAASAAGDETWTTVAKEKHRNPAFTALDEDDFLARQLAGLTAYPAYYARMAAINLAGAPSWDTRPLSSVAPEELVRLQGDGVAVVDGRPRGQVAAGHVPGSVNVELDDPSFGTDLGWLFPAGTRFVLVLGPGQDPTGAARQAARVGIETIAGVLDGEVDAWVASNRPLRSYPVTDVEGLKTALDAGGTRVLDVRQDQEWAEGHLSGAHHVHIPDLAGRVGELGGKETTYTLCQTGHRAAMAASILDAAGIPAVLVEGGVPDWATKGYPLSA